MKKEGKLDNLTVLIKSGGELGSAIAHRLFHCHFRLCITEVAHPLAVTRGVTFSEAIYEGRMEIEGVTTRLVDSFSKITEAWAKGEIPIIVDPRASVRDFLHPDVLVDAIMAKRNTGTQISDAPWVIGIGPGFRAGHDVHVAIETNNNNNLGRVILEGEAERDTAIPVAVGGYTFERVVHAPCGGRFTAQRELGDTVSTGDIVAQIGDYVVKAGIAGILRGLLRSGVDIEKETKVVEIDPVAQREECWRIRGAPRAVAGGVMEAILMRYNRVV